MSRTREIAIEVADLVDEKCEAYGDSLATTGAALRLLYPNGIRPEQYEDALLQARIWDKQSRAANRRDAFGEDPFLDITGYALRAVELHERRGVASGPCGNVLGAVNRSDDPEHSSAPQSASKPTMPSESVLSGQPTKRPSSRTPDDFWIREESAAPTVGPQLLDEEEGRERALRSIFSAWWQDADWLDYAVMALVAGCFLMAVLAAFQLSLEVHIRSEAQ